MAEGPGIYNCLESCGFAYESSIDKSGLDLTHSTADVHFSTTPRWFQYILKQVFMMHARECFAGCMQSIARPMYSNPPLHGALLVNEILGNKDLKQQWGPCPS